MRRHDNNAYFLLKHTMILIVCKIHLVTTLLSLFYLSSYAYVGRGTSCNAIKKHEYAFDLAFIVKRWVVTRSASDVVIG